MTKTMTAKFNGKCRICKAPLTAGKTTILYTPGLGAQCTACPAPKSAPAARPAVAPQSRDRKDWANSAAVIVLNRVRTDPRYAEGLVAMRNAALDRVALLDTMDEAEWAQENLRLGGFQKILTDAFRAAVGDAEVFGSEMFGMIKLADALPAGEWLEAKNAALRARERAVAAGLGRGTVAYALGYQAFTVVYERGRFQVVQITSTGDHYVADTEAGAVFPVASVAAGVQRAKDMAGRATA